ncbi:MAG: aminoglycoside phosphotransferase [Gammaproteobacteria bacterium]|nr:aminoglycoside phosphotransferase [Gammaproteobacteria bacterium]
MVPRKGDKERHALSDSAPSPSLESEPAVDVTELDRWMRAHVEGYEGPLSIEQFRGGQSNPTFALSTLNGSYVLRRKPKGVLLKGAHAVEREARVISALHTTGFPVPRVYGLCEDESVIGTAFFVMQLIKGRIFWDATFPEVSSEQRPRYFDAMNATIARLHKLDFVSLGLGAFGARGNYLGRQIARWSRQYVEDPAAGRNPDMDRLVEWLPKNIPSDDEVSLVHGDFRCDNLVFHAANPEIVAVLDWELSTLGHPLADFAYHLMMYRVPPWGVAGLVGSDLTALNIPSESDYVSTYCRRTGRSGIANLNFYLAYNLFRFAAILHGISGRVLRGTAVSSKARDLCTYLPAFARGAWEIAQA